MPRRSSASLSKRPKRQATTARLRGRVWIETTGNVVALTEPGADLLEQIDAAGSLSEAARKLRFSYRRAWMLLDAMNRRWSGPLVRTSVGGKRGGGAKLTDRGRAVLSAYRDLQLQVEHLLDVQTIAFNRATRG